MSQAAKIRVENLVKIFGDEPAGAALDMLLDGHLKDEIKEHTGHVVGVDRANFEVEEGEIFVVMGLSGSGKSTLIRCVNRLFEPTAGRVYVDDIDVTTLDETALQAFRRDHTGMVFQHFALFPHQTVVANVAFGLKVKGVDAAKRRATAIEALALVGLSGYEDSYPGQLSGGMQQRVGLARALATEPDILLMDEAFSALDPLIRRQMQDELIDLQSELQKTILFITHDLNEALRVGTRVCIMKDGNIHQIGSPEDILMRPATNYVAEFVQDVDQGRVLLVDSVTDEQAPCLGESSTVSEALAVMDHHGLDAVHIIDRNQVPCGLVHKKIAESVVSPQSDTVSALAASTHTVTSETVLAKVYRMLGEGNPIAVVDEGGRFAGSVTPVAVLSELGRVESISENLELHRSETEVM
jgi:glycine betaine/proline transport system ATP-binding protein